MIANYSEAKDEARRLTKVHGREVEVKSANCSCDYSKDCGKCAAQGYYFELVFASCDHLADDSGICEQEFCAEREQAQSEDLEAETFPAQHKPLSPVWANEDSEAA